MKEVIDVMTKEKQSAIYEQINPSPKLIRCFVYCIRTNNSDRVPYYFPSDRLGLIRLSIFTYWNRLFGRM